MTLQKVFAHISCSDLSASTAWYGHLFGRIADATPMEGLAEWHHGEVAGLQLFEDAGKAGQQTLTLIVTDLRGEHARLTNADLSPGAIEPADSTSLVRLADPDGSLVVLAQPGRA